VLQAVENKNIIASDDFLSSILETVKEGVLNCKIVAKDGKRSSDRSWRPAWAVLKKSGALFLCKEKKDNIMIPSVDSYPINLKNSIIDIAYDYTKRKNVFKIQTFSNSEYLFQSIDYESMVEWIKAMQENSTPPDLEKILKSSPVQASSTNSNQTPTVSTSNNPKSRKPDWLSNVTISNSSLNNNSSNNNTNQSIPNDQFIYGGSNNNKRDNSGHYAYEVSSPDEIYSSSQLSPTNYRKSDENSPRRVTMENQNQHQPHGQQNTNRKWVRQMTRRIRDFMTSSGGGQGGTDAQTTSIDEFMNQMNRNFSIPLAKCEPSTISPVS
jgi:hypothetical protein